MSIYYIQMLIFKPRCSYRCSYKMFIKMFTYSIHWNSYCQAQPQPQLKLNWAEMTIMSLLTGISHHPPTNPSRIVVWSSGLVHHLFETCPLFGYDMFIACSWLVQNLFMTCTWLVYNFFMTCSLLVDDLYRLVHDMFMSCPVHDFFMTHSWLE